MPPREPMNEPRSEPDYPVREPAPVAAAEPVPAYTPPAPPSEPVAPVESRPEANDTKNP